MIERYRPGPLGALVDESGRAAAALCSLLAGLDEEDLDRVRAESGELRTVRAVVEHVLMAAGIYRDMQRRAFGLLEHLEEAPRPETPRDGDALRRQVGALADAAWSVLKDKANWDDDQLLAVRMEASWGQIFDLEQLLEHALAHLLRHRRQLERWLEGEGRQTA